MVDRALSPWLPKSVPALRRYDLETFRADAIAGVTVGLAALPLAMAFAIASGLTPQAGICWAIVTSFLISAPGGSHGQIPAGQRQIFPDPGHQADKDGGSR
jgi:SulP family sulfate permease